MAEYRKSECISFAGPSELVPALSKFIAEVASDKEIHGDCGLVVEDRDSIIYDSKWIDILTPQVVERLVSDETWDLEALLDCLLSGEYFLLGVEYANGVGRLLYDPDAFPFGGTDPLKATVEAFGFRVTGDSFWDGFADWIADRSGEPPP